MGRGGGGREEGMEGLKPQKPFTVVCMLEPLVCHGGKLFRPVEKEMFCFSTLLREVYFCPVSPVRSFVWLGVPFLQFVFFCVYHHAYESLYS